MIVCLVGPTGVGKSEVALDLAERLGAEIVCADSRQVYRGLDIGTAKPSVAERSRVPHHLLDLVDPDEAYSAGRYARDAAACVSALHARGARVLLVGGTGLYVRALLWGLCDGPTADPDLRSAWLARERCEPGAVYRRLSDVDPASAAAIHPNDLPKALRAIEVFELTGTPLSAMQRAHGFRAPRYDAVIVGLRRDREDLYRRIDARVDGMVEAGLEEEVAGLMRRGYGSDAPGLRAVGYRQIVGALGGAYDLSEAIRLTKRDTRRYAKRQITWFAADPAVRWVDVKDDARVDEVVTRVVARLDDAVGVTAKRREGW
ncbi:MAG: tRNA (adenosine(37)-N6)-dimethylallyltransferase MiaA [Nitrospirota bacterium]